MGAAHDRTVHPRSHHHEGPLEPLKEVPIRAPGSSLVGPVYFLLLIWLISLILNLLVYRRRRFSWSRLSPSVS